jgi:hypothetical protein
MLSKAIKNCFSTSGRLLTWGETTFGWGRKLSKELNTPGQVEGFSNVAQVTTGRYHLGFLTTNSDLYTVGLSDNGRLGNSLHSNDI